MNFTNLKEFMDSLTDWIIPGNSIVVYKDNEQVFSYQSGYSDLENKKKMAGGEIFNIYSCSKPATVVAALQLYEKGKFLLDTPLYEFIPEFKDVTVRTANGEEEKANRSIKMRHLFTMTAGFGYNVSAPWRERAEKRTGGRMDTLEVMRELAKEPLYFHPGAKWNYSLCHDVLAAVVEVISGKRFCDYMRENIFEPLDMKSACYHADEAIYSKMAEQYKYKVTEGSDTVLLQAGLIKGSDGVVVNATKKNQFIFGEGYDSGGAGIITSVEDYAKFANALANGGRGATGEQILSSGTIDLLRADHLHGANIDTSGFDSWGTHKGHSYGLGVMTMTDRAKSGSNGSLGEFSWGGAAGATVFADPDRRIAYFYAHHMLNPQEDYYQPRLHNVVYSAF